MSPDRKPPFTESRELHTYSHSAGWGSASLPVDRVNDDYTVTSLWDELGFSDFRLVIGQDEDAGLDAPAVAVRWTTSDAYARTDHEWLAVVMVSIDAEHDLDVLVPDIPSLLQLLALVAPTVQAAIDSAIRWEAETRRRWEQRKR